MPFDIYDDTLDKNDEIPSDFLLPEQIQEEDVSGRAKSQKNSNNAGKTANDNNSGDFGTGIADVVASLVSAFRNYTDDQDASYKRKYHRVVDSVLNVINFRESSIESVTSRISPGMGMAIGLGAMGLFAFITKPDTPTAPAPDRKSEKAEQPHHFTQPETAPPQHETNQKSEREREAEEMFEEVQV